ncbi:MAG TPA: sigma-70 family RNA polymerase sigma factor [Kouleothrix sp.]|uniref:RNA polymerase sigma factor n=1 Tax=Kouleothrix sp. TaxID=2779161 RepID=UPI002B947AA0|nr:sigma-70 family RNA polymerase sigma factor [Kouleothrix sp.]
MARIAQRDTQALEVLYQRYARVVYGLALRMLGSAEQADDIVQETFWRVWRRSATFTAHRGTVPGWICGIAHNLSIDELRRQRVRPGQAADAADGAALAELPDTRSSVDTAAIENEQRRLIDTALRQLANEQRQAIELAYFGGLSQSEIAERLQSPVGTIKARIRSGLRRMRDVLAAQQVGIEDIIEHP